MKYTILAYFTLITFTVAAQELIQGYKTVNGLNMYYEIHGKGNPLVLIHGGGSTITSTFGRILPELAKTAMVIAVETQAHGHTKDNGRPLSFEQDADDISELLRQLNIARADFLGFSNGGSTVMRICMRHPDKVRKAVVCSSFYKRDGIYPQVWDFIAGGNVKTMPAQLKEAFLTINPDQDALKVMHDRDQQRMINFKDWTAADLKSIKAETLLVIGDQDVVKPEHAVEMYRIIHGSRLAVIPGDHGDYLGEITASKPGRPLPVVFMSTVLDFLK